VCLRSSAMRCSLGCAATLPNAKQSALNHQPQPSALAWHMIHAAHKLLVKQMIFW
jgi:hypothetical protein